MAKRRGQGGWVVTGLGFGVALGVALGTLVIAPALNIGGPVASEQATAQPADNQADTQAAEAQAQAADEVVAGSSSELVADTLTDRPVVVLVASDAPPESVDAVTDLLDQAGALNSGQITLTEKFFDQDSTDELMSLISNTLPAGAQLSEDNLSPGIHAGESLGSALMYDPETGEPLSSVADRALVLQTLREQGFIDYEDGTVLPAQGAVVLTGDGESEHAASVLADFATALSTRGDAVVAAGGESAAAGEGAIGQLRAEGPTDVSTVDSLDRAWAQVATVLALQEQFTGGAGAYGVAENTDSVMPTTE
ncbi:copper transporter [Corynebacterium lubricantis]|uniref:copper transporter n=1 Tax=Corynebacterium lubricantis TaxID=541095 RepID=UPI00035E22C0|nr:copper transporter [Corynebacterium lubricantis]